MQHSAGILLFRLNPELQIYLVHPGGPYFVHKDNGFWSIPKGGVEASESNLEAAIRELQEETSLDLKDIPEKDFIDLGEIVYASRKKVYIYAYHYEKEIPFKSITNWIEYPYKSGKKIEIPENDRGGWFGLEEATLKLSLNQNGVVSKIRDEVLARLEAKLS